MTSILVNNKNNNYVIKDELKLKRYITRISGK